MRRICSLVSLSLCLAPFASGQAVTQTAESDQPALPIIGMRAAATFWNIKDFIVNRDHAFTLGAPILVAGPVVGQMSWSPTGRFLAYDQVRVDNNVLNIQSATRAQKMPDAESVLSLYSLQDGKSVEVTRFDVADGHDDAVYWFANSDLALLLVSTPNEQPKADEGSTTFRLYSMNAANASIRDFNPFKSEGYLTSLDVQPSPTQPYAFITGTFVQRFFDKNGKRTLSEPTREVLLMTSAGDFTEIDPGQNDAVAVWSQDGTRAYVASVTMVNGKRKTDWKLVSLKDGSTNITPRPANFYMDGTPSGLLTIRSIQSTTTDGKYTDVRNNLWLETADPDSQNKVFLAGDASNGMVNATLDCASFTSQGSLFVRPITEVPKKVYDLALAQWNHIQTLQQSRQAGLALIMFAADMDNNFPSGKSNLYSLLGPYLRDSSLLNGFVYTFAGGSGTNLNPAATQLGYVASSDGKAIVYMDGHSVWQAKP
jgi:hypothetical protein